MNEYIKLAEQLEGMAQKTATLEKVASLCLMYMYSKNNGDLLSTPEVVKTAARMKCEDDLALELGVSMALHAFLGQEV